MQRQKFEAYAKKGSGLFKFDQIEAKCTWEEKGQRQLLDASHTLVAERWTAGVVRRNVTLTAIFDARELNGDLPAKLVELYKLKVPGMAIRFAIDNQTFEGELRSADARGHLLMLNFYNPQFMAAPD